MVNSKNMKAVKVLYEHFITNWDKYRANIHNPNVIKITAYNAKEILREKLPMEYEYITHKTKSPTFSWLFTLLMREFMQNGFRVEKKGIKKRSGVDRPVLYVYRQ
jgi:hypothetical protein